jgi:hypothetical protein
MSSNHIFVPFLNLYRSAEANHAVKPVTHQTETLSAGSLQRMLRPRQSDSRRNAVPHGVLILMLLLDAPQPIWVLT